MFFKYVSFIVAGILMLAMIAATVVEKYCGSEAAAMWIYHSPLTLALWGALLISAAAYIVRRRKAMTPGALLLHAAFAVILAGAALTHFAGVSGSLTLYAGDPPVAVFTDSHGAEHSLPFDIRLADCEIHYYPGTTAPYDFVSLLVFDGGACQASVSMNHVAEYRGYRFFQTGISDDSSTLSVQHDPAGIALTYCGYALLFVAMLALALRRRRPRARRAAVAVIAAVASLSLPAVAFAAEHLPRTPDRAVAMRLGSLMVCYNGRITPVSVMARDFCLKVHGSASYRGLCPEEVLAGWLFFYDEWKREPFVRVNGDEVQRAIGINGRYAALSDFYDYRGYKLQHCDPSPAVMQAHERTGLISAVCTGAAFKIYPVGSGEWVSWVSARPAEMSLDDWRFVRGSMEFVAREIAHNRHSSAWHALGAMRERQRLMAGDYAPSPGRIAAELLYVRHVSILPIAIVAFFGAIVGIIASRRRRWLARAERFVAALVFVAIAAVVALRCYISGAVPLSNGYETMLAISLCAAGFAALVGRASASLLRPVCMMVSAVVLIVAYMSSRNPAITPLTPVLSSPLLCVHVALVMAAYTLLAIIAANAAAALCRSHAADRYDINVRLLSPAVLLLAAGIFTGAIWANQSWGRYWGWDPKETWALITMMVYALPLHRRTFTWLQRPRCLNIYLLLAFASVIITYVGVNYILGGLHSYA